jgi:hypothetical protein
VDPIMTVFQHVVVGHDGSAGAAEAEALAQRLVDPSGEVALAAVEPGHMLRHPRGRGRTQPDVIELAETRRADLIVIGSDDGPAGRITPGRALLQLLQGAPCAVAAAPAGAIDDGHFRHVGIAYDGSPEAAAALATAYALAARDHSAVSLFCVAAPGAQRWGGGDPGAISRRRHGASGCAWRSCSTPRRIRHRPASTRARCCSTATPWRRSPPRATGSSISCSQARAAMGRSIARLPAACRRVCCERRRSPSSWCRAAAWRRRAAATGRPLRSDRNRPAALYG